jgi:phosphoglycerol transferase MdoB-like AlkP superfamily enzyme
MNLEKLFYYLKIISYSLAAIFAGYTVVDLDPKFLDKFTKIEIQTCILFILSAGFFDFKISQWKNTIIQITILTIILTFILQILRFYKKDKNNQN